MPFIVNQSSMIICVRNGISVPGRIFINRVARVMASDTHIDLLALPAFYWRVIQRWPETAEITVEFWLGNYGHRTTAILEPGVNIVAVDSPICPSAVDFWCEGYTFDGMRIRRYSGILTTVIYPEPRGFIVSYALVQEPTPALDQSLHTERE